MVLTVHEWEQMIFTECEYNCDMHIFNFKREMTENEQENIIHDC